MQLKAMLARLAGFLFTMTPLTACVSTVHQIDYGMQAENAGYVPARIAVLACHGWPNGARYRGEPLTNAQPGELTELCSTFDQQVLSGFSNQPYMTGFTPTYLAKLLAETHQENLLQEFAQAWQHRADACQKCDTAPEFYVNTIAPRTDWQTWLQSLSAAAKHADAVLLPFVTYAYSQSYNDRGLRVAERRAGVVLLLVDTNDGSLLWAGGREAEVANRKLEQSGVPQDVALPAWNTLSDRLFAEDLWREFPGRQVY